MLVYRDTDKSWDRHWATNSDLTNFFIRMADGSLSQLSSRAFKSAAQFQAHCAKLKANYIAEFGEVVYE